MLVFFSVRCKSEINGCSEFSLAFREDTFQADLTFKDGSKVSYKAFKYRKFLFFHLSAFYSMSSRGVIMSCYVRGVVTSFNSKILQKSHKIPLTDPGKF